MIGLFMFVKLSYNVALLENLFILHENAFDIDFSKLFFENLLFPTLSRSECLLR